MAKIQFTWRPAEAGRDLHVPVLVVYASGKVLKHRLREAVARQQVTAN